MSLLASAALFSRGLRRWWRRGGGKVRSQASPGRQLFPPTFELYRRFVRCVCVGGGGGERREMALLINYTLKKRMVKH